MGNEIRRQTEGPLVHYLMKVCQPTHETRARESFHQSPDGHQSHILQKVDQDGALSHMDQRSGSSFALLRGVQLCFCLGFAPSSGFLFFSPRKRDTVFDRLKVRHNSKATVIKINKYKGEKSGTFVLLVAVEGLCLVLATELSKSSC